MVSPVSPPNLRRDSRRCQGRDSLEMGVCEEADGLIRLICSVLLRSYNVGEGAEEEDSRCVDEERSIHFRQGAFRTFAPFFPHRTATDCRKLLVIAQ